MSSFRLPYFYNLAFAVLPPFLIASLCYTSFVGVGSWSMNRTINWGWHLLPYQPQTLEEYFKLTLWLTLLPSFFTAGYFIFRYVKRKDVFMPKALGILLLMTLFCIVLPKLA